MIAETGVIVKSKNRLFVLLVVVIMALVSIPECKPMIQIYDRGYTVARMDRVQRVNPFQIYDGHLEWTGK